MNTLSPARARIALLALALGGFGIGTTEFVAGGLLPNIARDLLPTLYTGSPHDAIGQAGAVISAYAAGVVVGAPTIAAFAARFPRKRLLVVLAIAFTVGTVLSAVAPTFETVVAARFLAGLPHGAYFGVAALVASSIMGPGKRGAGIAFVLAGLTIANIVGVPLITLLGQVAGWRVSYLVVASIFLLTVVAIQFAVPKQPGDPAATLGRELKAFGSIRVWLALLTGALGFAGFFAVQSYIAPLTTEVAHLSESTVSLVLVGVGVGMTVGNLIGGRLADLGALRAIFLSFGAFTVALLAVALTAANPVGLFVSTFLIGASASALSPAIQTRLMDVAGESQTIAAAVNHSALNIGNSLGALLGGMVIAAGFGYTAPAWVGLILVVPGVGFALAGALVSRSRARRDGGVALDSEAPARRVLDEDAVLDRTFP